jgi:hypothetical protein
MCIYIGVPLCNPRGGCVGADGLIPWGCGQIVRGGDVRETLKTWTPHPGEIPNGPGQTSIRRWSRTYIPIIQHIF